jgi:predicted transcriptional regulator
MSQQSAVKTEPSRRARRFRITVSLEPETVERLEAMATQFQRTLSEMVEIALNQLHDRMTKERKIGT